MAIFFRNGSGGCSCARESCDDCETYKKYKEDYASVEIDSIDDNMPPSRRCVFCGRYEHNSNYVSRDTWICLDCVKKIGNLIGERADD